MSYPTAEKLQYGVTPAQSSRRCVHMFRHLSIAIGFFPQRTRGDLDAARSRLAGAYRLTADRRAHRMPATCRPEKAARFVFRGWLSMRSRQCAHRGRLQPSVIAMTKSATSHLLPVFARADLGFERGEGVWLIATNGERYLDFTSGVAVNALGHAHPHLVAALQEQATKLWHMSNLFKSPDGERLAARLCEASFADFVFFANSGAEAMECAIKITRKYHAAKGHPERYRIITFDGAFHGRTLATLAATGSPKYLEGFGPPMDGFDQVPLGDLEAVKKAIGPQTAGILIEPLQGEGGVRAAPHAFFRALRQLCDDQRPAVDLRRGADRHGPHRRAVRLQAPRRHAGRDVAGQGARRRLSDRRLPGDGRGRGRHDAGLARLDLRRQSAGGRRGQRGARRHAQARLLRACAEDVAAAQAEARLGGRSPSRRARRGARRGAADRRQGGGAVGRSGDRAARPEAAHGRRRRQCGAVPAAVDRHRGGDRGIRAAARARLRRPFPAIS